MKREWDENFLARFYLRTFWCERSKSIIELTTKCSRRLYVVLWWCLTFPMKEFPKKFGRSPSIVPSPNSEPVFLGSVADLIVYVFAWGVFFVMACKRSFQGLLNIHEQFDTVDCNWASFNFFKVWSVAAKRYQVIQHMTTSGGVSRISFSPDGSKMLAATPGSSFRVFDAARWSNERWSKLEGRLQVIRYSVYKTSNYYIFTVCHFLLQNNKINVDLLRSIVCGAWVEEFPGC